MSKKNSAKKSKKGRFKRELLEWGGLAAVAGILYVTGLHTEVLGGLQRIMLWTGLFDADIESVETLDGPMLSEATYSLPLRTMEGERVQLSDYKNKVLFINVWASWCPPCVAEMPTIESLYNFVSHHDDIQFLMISQDEEPQKAIDFMERKEFSMPYHFPLRGLPTVFRSSYIPSTYVISKEGKVIFKHEGIADYSSRSFKYWLLEQANKE